MKIYTKGGDKGRTSLVGGARIAKSDPRIEAYGTLDELTAQLGYFYDMYLSQTVYAPQMAQIVSRVMDAAAVLATPEGVERTCTIEQQQIEQLEQWIDLLSADLPRLTSFTLPMGAPSISFANVCRTVCRRAERAIVRVEANDHATLMAQIYINRLSDYLYVLGRQLGVDSRAAEILWSASLDMTKK